MANKKQKNIRLSPRLLDELAREAERAGEAEVTVIEAALERELERRRMAREGRQDDSE